MDCLLNFVIDADSAADLVKFQPGNFNPAYSVVCYEPTAVVSFIVNDHNFGNYCSGQSLPIVDFALGLNTIVHCIRNGETRSLYHQSKFGCLYFSRIDEKIVIKQVHKEVRSETANLERLKTSSRIFCKAVYDEIQQLNPFLFQTIADGRHEQSRAFSKQIERILLSRFDNCLQDWSWPIFNPWPFTKYSLPSNLINAVETAQEGSSNGEQCSDKKRLEHKRELQELSLGPRIFDLKILEQLWSEVCIRPLYTSDKKIDDFLDSLRRAVWPGKVEFSIFEVERNSILECYANLNRLLDSRELNFLGRFLRDLRHVNARSINESKSADFPIEQFVGETPYTLDGHLALHLTSDEVYQSELSPGKEIRGLASDFAEALFEFRYSDIELHHTNANWCSWCKDRTETWIGFDKRTFRFWILSFSLQD